MEIGWSELLVIGVVALIVIGPKDLPEMFRTLGRFTAKLRVMSRDFTRAMEDAARETGVKDVADDLKSVTSPGNLGLDAVRSAADKFEKWDPLKNNRSVTPAAVPPVAPAAAAAVPAQMSAASAAGLGSAVVVSSPLTAGADAAADADPTDTLISSAIEALNEVPDPKATGAKEAASALASVKPGSHTAELAERQAERAAIAREASEKMRATFAAPAPAAAAVPVAAAAPVAAPPAFDPFEDAPMTVTAPPAAPAAAPVAPPKAAKPKAVKAKAEKRPAAAASAETEAAETPAPAAKKPAARKPKAPAAEAKPASEGGDAPAKPVKRKAAAKPAAKDQQ